MPLRWQEVALPLVLIIVLLVLKHVPVTQHLPLARGAGIVAFGYAAFLAMRLMQDEKAVFVDGWSELRPSMVEYSTVYGAGALSLLLMFAVTFQGWYAGDPGSVLTAFLASLSLGFGAVAIGMTSIFVRVRWNHRELEYRSAFGREKRIAWSDVKSCRPSWRGVAITTHDRQRITFSQFHSGAAELARHATNRARRNLETATKAFATP